jgi:hypothetical protein
LLKRKSAGDYYQGPGQFAAEPVAALLFASVPAAARFALVEQMPDAVIVLRSDYLAEEIRLPVLREWVELEERQQRLTKESNPIAVSTLVSPAAPA